MSDDQGDNENNEMDNEEMGFDQAELEAQLANMSESQREEFLMQLQQQ